MRVEIDETGREHPAFEVETPNAAAARRGARTSPDRTHPRPDDEHRDTAEVAATREHSRALEEPRARSPLAIVGAGHRRRSYPKARRTSNAESAPAGASRRDRPPILALYKGRSRGYPCGMEESTPGIVARGRAFLRHEGDAILAAAARLGDRFEHVVGRLLAGRGRVAVTGVGKSGIIAEKIAATLSSTGTPAFFLRPVEALHGDLGMLVAGDVLIAISHSGETAEVLAVSSAARALGVETIAFTGDVDSTLARGAALALDTGVEAEACPLGLAPTTSTTVTLALGDALALVLLEERGFTSEHYARFHPGGSLGERLRYRVEDVMRSGDDVPIVRREDPLAHALDAMTACGNLGLTLVVDGSSQLVGIVTDGDLRRRLRTAGSSADLLGARVGDVMTANPRTVPADASVKEALQIMEVRGITSLAVVDHQGRVSGLIHLHDVLGRGKIVL